MMINDERPAPRMRLRTLRRIRLSRLLLHLYARLIVPRVRQSPGI